jgi:hypothetical protein
MFGNTTGWIISAGVGLLMTILLSMVVLPPTPTAPTNAAVLAIARTPLAIPVDPSTVVPRGTSDADAAVLYRQAIKEYLDNPVSYEKFNKTENRAKFDLTRLTALDFLIKARDCKTCNLFQKKPEELINYDNAQPALDALNDLGQMCCTVGMLYDPKFKVHDKPEEARKLWEAAFILGQHFYEERLTWAELGDGLGLMQTAAINLQHYYTDIQKDQSKADDCQKFVSAEQDYQSKVVKAITLITGVDENAVGQYAGDFFAIAAAKPGTTYAAADPMWRIEAIKHVGKYRFNAMTTGDQLAARKVLSNMVKDTSLSPPIKEAATAAHDLTEEKYHAFG